MIFPWRDIAFLSWQQYLHKEVPRHYSSESTPLHKPPWTSIPSNPRSLDWEPKQSKAGRPCSGDDDHRRRGPRSGKSSGSYCGLVALLVVDGDGRNGEVRLEPEVTAEGSPSTAELRWRTSTSNLRTRTSESWGTCTCHQLDEHMLDRWDSTETDAAAARKNAGERRKGTVVH
jgi:hypothetical protein